VSSNTRRMLVIMAMVTATVPAVVTERLSRNRTVHFVYGLRDQEEPFALVHYLAIASAIAVLQPTQILMHLGELPYGIYWDLIRPHLEIRRVKPVEEVEARSTVNADVASYRYAHHADVIRLDALIEEGGCYLDIDTLTIAPIPVELWEKPFVIGEESWFAGQQTPTLLNAVMLAQRESAFASIWRAHIVDALDGSWSAHSCELAARLAEEYPNDVTVVDAAKFSRFGATTSDLERLLMPSDQWSDAAALDGACVLHLCEHLWWSEDRRDFLNRSGWGIDEADIRAGRSLYARAAQPFLHEHGLLH
jgi:hypothetical protein